MITPHSIGRPFAILVLAGMSSGVSAQVFIPDTTMRNWLDQYIPGIVDANGIMDTLHSGIATLDSMQVAATYWTDGDLDLDGIQYLDSLVSFRAFVSSYPFNMDVQIPALPLTLDQLLLSMDGGNVTLPYLDHHYSLISIGDANFLLDTLNIFIAGILDTIDVMQVDKFIDFQVGDPSGRIEALKLTGTVLEVDPSNLPDLEYGTVFVGLSPPTYAVNIDLASFRIEDLWIDASNFVEVQNWPDSVETINIFTTGTCGHLGAFPATVGALSIHSSSLPICLPYLPESLTFLSLGFSGVTCIPNYPSSINYYSGPMDPNQQPIICSVLNTDCPGTAAALAGHVYVDLDADGQRDPGEPPMYSTTIAVQPGNMLVPVQSSGWWERGVVPDTYTVSPSSAYPYATSYSPLQHTPTLSFLGDVDSTNSFGYVLMPNVQDLVTTVSATPARPGFDNTVSIGYLNYGTIPLDGELAFTFDTDQSWIGSTVPPTTMNGNTAIWALPGLELGELGAIQVTLHTDVGVPLGTGLTHNVVLGPIATDATANDNLANWTDTVVGSYDPNDKLLTPRVLSPSQVQDGNHPVTYTIRFQNTGTYLAERVVILDTLSEDLQWETLQFLGSSHPCAWYLLDGVAHFIFDDILLPDSASDEPGSQGFVQFRILPSDQLQNGAAVSNIAHIVFDFNEPIITEPAILEVDISASVEEEFQEVITIFPNPAKELLRLSGMSERHSRTFYTIRDLLGKVVQQGVIERNGTIELVGISPGSYLLQIGQGSAVKAIGFVKY